MSNTRLPLAQLAFPSPFINLSTHHLSGLLVLNQDWTKTGISLFDISLTKRKLLWSANQIKR